MRFGVLPTPSRWDCPAVRVEVPVRSLLPLGCRSPITCSSRRGRCSLQTTEAAARSAGRTAARAARRGEEERGAAGAYTAPALSTAPTPTPPRREWKTAGGAGIGA